MLEVQIEERLGVEALAVVIMNFESEGIEVYRSLVAALERSDYRSKPMKLVLDMKHCQSSSARPSIEEAPKLEFKDLPPYLMYVLLGRDYTLPVIIPYDFNFQQIECFVKVLKMFKRAIGWTIVDIIWIRSIFVHTKSNLCLITSQVLSTTDG